MRNADQLRELATSFRSKEKRRTDNALVESISADVAEYRQLLIAHRQQTPVPPLDELLPLMGWLIYEASWETLQRIPTAWDRPTTPPKERARHETDLRHLNELANAARGLPWPEFAPRALGAIRALALAESKRDTVLGYNASWTLHQEGRRKYSEYRDTHGTDEARKRFVRDLDEVLLQLALAETGTACRVTEQVISQWGESYATESEDKWTRRMFRDVSAGVAVGELAIDTARQIREEYGFVDAVSEDRLAMKTALQNPGIMTARAALLQLVLGREMQRLGSRPEGHETWADWERHTLDRFVRAYEAIEESTTDDGSDPGEMREDLARQLIHMRLNLALLKPGYHLPSQRSFHPCLSLARLDAEALEALSTYLAGEDKEQGRERGIGAATMPAFIRGIRACRELGEDDDGYDRWREQWFHLDQLRREDGRQDRVRSALTRPAEPTGRTR
jgi:hypothetical protein